MKLDRKHSVYISLIVLINVALDQISKAIVRGAVEYNEEIEIIGDAFIMTKIENSGAFLSMGEDWAPWLRAVVLLVIPALVLVGLFVYLLIKPEQPKWNKLGFACIVGGGLANLYDRIMYGEVTDFLHIDLGFADFAKTGIFNIADVSIMVGLGFLFLGYWQEHKEKKQADKVAE